LTGRSSLASAADGGTVDTDEQVQPSYIDTWLKSELERYADAAQHRVVRGPPSAAVLKQAMVEFADRFRPLSMEEEEEMYNGVDDACPYLLVALDVDPGWVPPRSCAGWRFTVQPISATAAGTEVDTTALFITFMPGNHHGTAHGYLAERLGVFFFSNGLDQGLMKTAVDCTHVDDDYHADIRADPEHRAPAGPGRPLDDDNGVAFSRAVVEIEYGHRSTTQLRRIGHEYLSKHYCRVFLAIKLWAKDGNGTFGAVAMLWVKDAAGNITLADAVDFGSKPLTPVSLKTLRSAPANHLCRVAGPGAVPVLPAAQATGRLRRPPAPAAAMAAAALYGAGVPPPATWPIHVPASALLYTVYDGSGTPIQAPPPGLNWTIDLYQLQQRHNRIP